MIVYQSNGQSIKIDVTKEIAHGGEGTIYFHPNDKNKVIKIYHNHRPNSFQSTLLKLSNLSHWFVKPIEIFFDNQKNVVGFSMQYLPLNTFWLLKQLFNKNFCFKENIDIKLKTKVYENLKARVVEAHNVGVIIGDLNQYNIYVNKNGDVYMLDVDSYAPKGTTHNGVMLEDIRDWTTDIIDEKSDTYSFDVLINWMLTYVHPFGGTHKTLFSIENRVKNDTSIYGDIKNIVLPPMYVPITNKNIISQFERIFQKRERFFVDLNATQLTVQQAPKINILNSNDLYIKLINDDAKDIVSNKSNIAIKTSNDTWKIFNVQNHSKYFQIATSDSEFVWFGNHIDKYFEKKNEHLFFDKKQIQNFSFKNLGYNSNILYQNDSLFCTNTHEVWCLNLSGVMNDKVDYDRTDMFVQSLIFTGDGVYQFLGSKKMLLKIGGRTFSPIKTNLNVKNFYEKNGYFLIEHIQNNKTNYTFAQVKGNVLVEGANVSDFGYFDIKDNLIFFPKDGQIDVISPSNYQIITSIDCPICDKNSQIFITNAGIVLRNEKNVYLLNKK